MDFNKCKLLISHVQGKWAFYDLFKLLDILAKDRHQLNTSVANDTDHSKSFEEESSLKTILVRHTRRYRKVKVK